jgi:glycosyltransferase involved in cell wall biosynthesis
MSPLVSIIIPAYNAAPWISATLDSALAQTHRPIEIIVVDDGSKDASLAIAQSYEARGVRVVSQSNAGASSARNHALRLAQGDYIQFLDADDLLAPDKISLQIAVLTAPGAKAQLVAGEWARFYSDPAAAVFKADALWCSCDAVTWQTKALTDNLMMHPAAWVLSRALSDRAGVWNETLTLNDDGEYFARVRFVAGNIDFVSGAKSFYRSGLKGSLSSADSRPAIASAYRSHELIHGLLRQHEDSSRTRQACADSWVHFAFTAAPICTDLTSRALREARTLGSRNLQPGGGRIFRIACRLFGWRRVLRWRHLVTQFRS